MDVTAGQQQIKEKLPQENPAEVFLSINTQRVVFA
jgi:hypothetical protein